MPSTPTLKTQTRPARRVLPLTLGPLLLGLAACGTRWDPVPDTPPPGLAPEDLRADLQWLLAEPRGAGSLGSTQASDEIAARFEGLGLHPYANSGASWRAPVPLPGVAGGAVQMVLGRLPGRTGPVDGELVVVTARGDASGVALLLGLAEALAADPPARSVLFVATPCSDIGDLGVNRLLDTAPMARLRQIRCAVHLERLGRVATDGWGVSARAFAEEPLARLEAEAERFDVPLEMAKVRGALPPTAIFDSAGRVELTLGDLNPEGMSRAGRALRRWIRYLADG